MISPNRIVIRGIAVAVVGIVFIPYVWGYLHVPPGMVYMGFADHPYDQNSYLSRIQQASEGKFFIRRDFTLEPQRPLFFNPFTWTLGVIAGVTGLTPLAVYYGALAFYALLLFYIINWFIRIFVADPRQRVFAFALCAFSSGLCWLVPLRQWEVLLKKYNMVPIDYWIAETITFETVFSFPQFSLTAALMLLGFGFLIKALRGSLVKNSICGGLAIFALSFVHTVDMVTVAVVLAVYTVVVFLMFKRDGVRTLGAVALLSLVALPAFGYMLYLFRTEPVFIQWSKEKFISPHFLSYIIGYGIVLFLAVPELVRIFREGSRDDWFLAVWVIAVAVLLYAPVSFQRRLSTAVHIPLCILAARATFRYVLPSLLGGLWPRGEPSGQRRDAAGVCILVALFLIMVPANIVKISSCIADTRRNPLEYYLYEADLEAMRWMRENHNEDAAILSTYKSGLYLPAYTGNRVYVGHWSETLNFNEKAATAERVLYSGKEADAREFLKEHKIDYIYFGAFEKMRGRFSLEHAPFLQEIYNRRGVSIYKVKL
ncbi:MAG: hypothetical protein NTZ78_14405 [Candidatus Aureabacteria bacterium]|nr:hypothetical protein [Candidatus Auribacterota bacterium]